MRDRLPEQLGAEVKALLHIYKFGRQSGVTTVSDGEETPHAVRRANMQSDLIRALAVHEEAMREKCQDDMLHISTAKLVTKPSHPSEVDTLTKELASLREKLRLQKASGPPDSARQAGRDRPYATRNTSCWWPGGRPGTGTPETLRHERHKS